MTKDDCLKLLDGIKRAVTSDTIPKEFQDAIDMGANAIKTLYNLEYALRYELHQYYLPMTGYMHMCKDRSKKKFHMADCNFYDVDEVLETLRKLKDG